MVIDVVEWAYYFPEKFCIIDNRFLSLCAWFWQIFGYFFCTTDAWCTVIFISQGCSKTESCLPSAKLEHCPVQPFFMCRPVLIVSTGQCLQFLSFLDGHLHHSNLCKGNRLWFVGFSKAAALGPAMLGTCRPLFSLEMGIILLHSDSESVSACMRSWSWISHTLHVHFIYLASRKLWK